MSTEARLVEVQRRLEASHEEFSELIYAISHDLKQPIVGILGFASILRDDLSGVMGPDQATFLEKVIDNARKMDRMLSSLLQLSRAARHPEPGGEADMGIVLDDVLTRSQEEIQDAGAQIRRSSALPPVLLGAHDDLAQLFRQIVQNAILYRRPGVPLVIEVGVGAPLEDSPRHHHLFVRDNGVGIPARFHEEIFRVCRRLAPGDLSRAGVGLAIARKVCERYEGRIWVESREGEGATFHIAWPRERLYPELSAAASETATP